MATLKERFDKWKSERSIFQKAGDILFWALIVLMLIPGPRKAIATGANRVFLKLKTPSEKAAEKQVSIDENDYKWNFRDSKGVALELEQFRGEVLFVNFWATWCPPCVAEMPEIESLYQKYGDKVEFLMLTGDKADKVGPFMEKHGYSFPVYHQTSQPVGALEHSSYPTTFIVSRSGQVVSRKIGAANWDSKATHRILDRLIAE